MNFDDSFYKRVAIARTSLGLTQEELAKRVGIVKRQIAAYEGSDAKPRDKVLQNLAAALGTTSEWLAQGIGSGPNITNVKRTVTVREIPVLTHVQARFSSFEDLLKTAAIKDFIAAPDGANEDCYAVEIQGDSMSAGEGMSFPPGSIVTFNCALKAMHGDYVMCVLDDHEEAFFKQLIIDQGQPYLRSLNHNYPMITPDFLEVVGVAIHSQIRLHREGRDLPGFPNEIDRLIAEKNRVSQEFWANPNLSSNPSLDERLVRLEKITSRLEKIIVSEMQQALDEHDFKLKK
ncbi:hypothetical protein CIG19_21160 [Enterobacterales bacterium CwR94]|nr:hypothetical protein CIG19_21160 [Enterobacterales bacterium CwR94]